MILSTTWKGNFAEKLGERIAKWASSPPIAAVIKVPPELGWWHAQEFGVDHPYEIPVAATGVAFAGRSGVIIRPQVTHPGLHPTHTVGTVVDSLPEIAKAELPTLFAEADFNPDIVRSGFVATFMPQIKAEIVKQMAVDLPGTRPANPEYPKQGGKLGGRTAADVFDENATIEEI